VTTPLPTLDGASVTAVLVSREGARWLPAVLDGLAAQTRPPDRVVAVDTASTDESPQLLRDRLGDDAVLDAPADSPFGAAVTIALDGRPPISDPAADTASDNDWVWLLHDDSAPAPDALERLLDVASAQPSIGMVGPKLREWPSLRRLLEVGVTISGTGRRETGLERGEYDQGQHDQVRDVLAVNTAGMLVRRSVLESLGFDRRLPLFGNDIDLGWRAARAGHRTVVVPDAVVFHVEAAHRGVRRPTATHGSHRRGERAAALYTLLTNCSAPALPFLVVRLLLGSLLRALGLLLVRAPREAVDELAGLVRTYAHPLRILSGRRARRRTATVGHREVRHLLPPPWLPYRHGVDFVSDVAAAVVSQAGEMSAARRVRTVESTETGPVPAEAQNLPEESGLLVRLVTSPVAWVFTALTVAAVVAARGLLGTGMLSGGALLPAPGSAGDWWRLYLSSWHELGVGSSAPAAPYLLPLALLGSVLLGKAWLVVDIVFLLAVPLAAYGADRFLRRATGSLPAAVWGGVAYGLLPVLTGAVPQGRLGTVVAALVLPWLAHAALFLAPGEDQDRRVRAAWRTALWLALLAAFAPLGLPLAAALTVVTLLVGLGVDRVRWVRREVWWPVLVPVVVAFVLLLPWSVAVWGERGFTAWLFEAGLPAPGWTQPVGRLDVLFGRPAEQGAPWWLGLGVVLAALAALLRADTRPRVLRAWVVIVLGLVTASLLSGVAVTPATSEVSQPVWLGLPLLLAQAAAVAAAATAGAGVRAELTGVSFGWRQPVGAALVVVALLAPVAGLAWWVVSGSGEPLDRRPAAAVPTYMSEAGLADPDRGVLVVRGDRARGFDHLLLHGRALSIGDESVLPSAEDQQRLTDVVSRLVTAPVAEDVERLADFGVGFVYAPAPVDGLLAGNLDTLSGTSRASALRGARAWQLQGPAGHDALDRSGSDARPWLLGAQALALVVAAVQAAPTRRVAR